MRCFCSRVIGSRVTVVVGVGVESGEAEKAAAAAVVGSNQIAFVFVFATTTAYMDKYIWSLPAWSSAYLVMTSFAGESRVDFGDLTHLEINQINVFMIVVNLSLLCGNIKTSSSLPKSFVCSTHAHTLTIS